VAEEFVPGRVTVKLDDGLISKALLEYEGFTREWIREAEWPPPPPQLVGPGEVFVLGEPLFIGKRTPRKDLPAFPESEVRTRETPWGTGETLDPPARGQRGWFIQSIESLYVDARRISGPKIEPSKPEVSPRFTPVLW
jgi:hypothetical protein